MSTCPCGSGTAYEICCGRFHAGDEPETAEQLMRARYCAFAKRQPAFLVRTSHPLERARLKPNDFASSFALSWQQLEIVATDAGGPDDDEGLVHFRATFATPDGQTHIHDERSRFKRIAGCWIYRDAKG